MSYPPPRGLGVVDIDPEVLAPMLDDFQTFVQPYLRLFGRSQVRENAERAIRGMLSDIPRKSAERLAEFNGQPRRAMQRFVGAGPWKDAPFVDRLCSEVAHEIGQPDGVLIVDPTSFAKKGDDSVGVKRQWCGRLGKTENCQVGVFLSYASKEGQTLVDYRLYLPEEWAADKARREACYVPEEVTFRTTWELADELIANRASTLPHSWVLGDEEFGRAGELRDRLAARGERYMLDAPSDVHVRILGQGARRGRRPDPVPARDWVGELKDRDWTLFTVRDGTKGPLQVQVAWTKVVTNRAPGKKKGDWSRNEVLLVVRTLGQQPQTKYLLTNADSKTVPLSVMVQAACTRWRIEDCFERAKGEVGLHHYEVRSWTGWHHHMTLGLIGLWFLTLQHSKVRKRFPPLHGSAGTLLHRGTPAGPATPRRLRRGPNRQRSTHPQRAVAHSPLGQRETQARGDADSGRVVSREGANHVAQ
jgi:SRSO17 transposase